MSSSRASPDFLPKPNPLSDPQLLTTVESYDASKYVGDLVVSKLDEEFRARSVSGLDVNVEKKTEEEKRPVRCLVVDPGVVWTGMFGPFLPWILEMCMAMTFFLVSPLCLLLARSLAAILILTNLPFSRHDRPDGLAPESTQSHPQLPLLESATSLSRRTSISPYHLRTDHPSFKRTPTALDGDMSSRTV